MNEFDPEVLEGQGLSALEQKQQLLAHHVKMVARKLSHALFVFGSQGGLGKAAPFSAPWTRKASRLCWSTAT